MPTVNAVVETKLSTSTRARQVSAMFDVPAQKKCRLEWKIDAPFEAAPWNVGLIVGPSGSGKSTVAKHLFGEPSELEWKGDSVIDDFPKEISIQRISEACGAVGFNTIPAWLRPHAVLSNGEKFRVEVARRLLIGGDAPIVIDEFTSVVDRQVAQVGSHAIQKLIRKENRQFVAATCHYDVIDWLQPDWVIDVATRSFSRRLLQRRPPIECEVKRVPWETWRLFAPFHYLSAELHRGARCFALHVHGHPVAFAGMLHRPHPTVDDIMGCSRLVTLPDWQGVGLAMALINSLGSAYKAVGKRTHIGTAHPGFVRAFARAPKWRMEKKPGFGTSTRRGGRTVGGTGVFGLRPAAMFSYAGPAMPRTEAERLLG